MTTYPRVDRAKLVAGVGTVEEVEIADEQAAILADSAYSLTEYCLAGDLEEPMCPTCTREIPEGFFMFRPLGLEYWRCLSCLARTMHGGALHQRRIDA